MSMPPPEHLHMRDRMPGTLWRALRPLLVFVIVVGVFYTMVSVGIAIATADDCSGGGTHLNNVNKEWNYFPPQWECKTSTAP